MRNQSLFVVEGGGVHIVFMGGRGGENQLSPTEYKGDTSKILPPRRPVPIKNVFNGGICTSVQMLHLTTHNCFIFFFFLIYNPFQALFHQRSLTPWKHILCMPPPPSPPPPSPHDLLHHSSKQLKSLELQVIKNVFKMIHTLNYLQSQANACHRQR